MKGEHVLCAVCGHPIRKNKRNSLNDKGQPICFKHLKQVWHGKRNAPSLK